MSWDTGAPVLVTGEDFVGAWRLEGGDEARDGDLNRRLDGGTLKARGLLRVNDAGVTAVKVGVETQDVLRAATAESLYTVPLPALDTWTAFEGWITPAADQVWGRPYIAVEGTGEVDFAEVFIQRGQVHIPDASIDTPQIADNAVTLPGQSQATSPTTLTDAPSTGVLLRDVTLTTEGGNVWLVFSMAWLITNTQELEFYVYVDATYAGGASPTGYSYFVPVETSSSGGIQNNTTFSALISGLPAGSHTFYVYARNATGSAVDIGVRTLICVELKK